MLAILSVYFANSTDGWSLATASLRAAEPDFSRQARLLGETTAQLHVELAAAFGTSVLSRFALTDLVDAMDDRAHPGHQGRPAAPRARGRGSATAMPASPEPATQVAVQRIHGDYHLAQVLGTDGGWVVLDFEGEPSVPLARRRAFAPAAARRRRACSARSTTRAGTRRCGHGTSSELSRLAEGSGGVGAPMPGGVLRGVRGGMGSRPGPAGRCCAR